MAPARFIGVVALGMAMALSTTGAASPGPDHKVDVCHIPPGNPANAHTINVDVSAVPAHLAHGDYLGECRGVVSGSR